MRKALAAAAAVFGMVLATASAALAAEPKAPIDNLPNPKAEQQGVLMQKALQLKLQGKIDANSKVGKVAKGQYVPLQRTGQSKIFVILAQFGNQIVQPQGGTPGPLANQIPAPDRTVDNSTIWFDGGYTPQHYNALYFDQNPTANSVTNYYQGESSGRFNFTGSVTDWVTVPYNEARYGTNLCGSTVCSTVWQLLRDAANQWVLDQEAKGQTLDQIKAYLAQFDQEDRYDYNGNGNFNEPDGYIDHFQLIHAGEGEEIGGGAQGSDAIWSHRWYAWQSGSQGPGPANGGQFGGFEIGAKVGQPTGFWVGDYAMEPENAGVGVIAHETGHDYGLPDEYDTSYAGEAPSTWWTIMSQGSYGNDNLNGIGNRPVDFDAWDKFQLGWLNYDVARPFTQGKAEFKLGPAETNTKQTQGVFVVLPKKGVAVNVGKPTEGTHALYSGSGDSYEASAARSIAVPTTGATLTSDVWYDIEQDWDYTWLQVSTDNGATWHNVHTNLSTNTDPNGQNAGGEGITGTSGAGQLDDWYTGRPSPQWVPLAADLSAYAGQTVLVRFDYWTDVAEHGLGFEFDNLKLGSTSDGVETTTGWTLSGGFHSTTGTDVNYFNNYYVVENRQYMNYDTGLRTSPYNFFDPARPNWVEHYPFEDGVLVSYWDTSQGDNNTGEHPGDGLILPIDVHPDPILKDDGTPARDRVQAYDATLTTRATDSFTLHNGATGGSYVVPSQPGVTTFDDRNSYWNPKIPAEGVQTPGYGTIIRLKSIDSAGFANVSIEKAQ
jgi:immune inhibitor A